MSLVTAAISKRSRSALQSARVSAVFPEPTGPPMPTRSAPPLRSISCTRPLCPVTLSAVGAQEPDEESREAAEGGAADDGEPHPTLPRLQHVVEHERDEREEERPEDRAVDRGLAHGPEGPLRLLHECVGHGCLRNSYTEAC